MSSKAVGAMSVDDVAGWAAGAFDDATVRVLREGEIDGPLLAIYAQKEDHELLKRDLGLTPGKAAKLWRATRQLSEAGGAEEGTPPASASRRHATPTSSAPKADPSMQTMSIRALKKRAAAAGVTEEQLEDAEDEDDHKAAIIELVVEAESV